MLFSSKRSRMNINWKKKSDRNELVTKIQCDVPFLSFLALEETGLVSHGFSTRLGGVSQGQYSTMNFTFTRGDNPDHVMENYRRMGAALNVDYQKMVLSYQTHTTNIRLVTQQDAGKGIIKERDYEEVDGLITDIPGITLVTFYADCVPLYLLDPVHKAIGLSHSGWRGTANHMGKCTIEAMSKAYGSKAEDLIVGIGPSICQECYEVGPEVAAEFQKSFSAQDRTQFITEKANGKYQLDLWKANEIIFTEAGVRKEQIHITDICTHCNSDYLFSHRKTGNARGNLAAFFCLI